MYVCISVYEVALLSYRQNGGDFKAYCWHLAAPGRIQHHWEQVISSTNSWPFKPTYWPALSGTKISGHFSHWHLLHDQMHELMAPVTSAPPTLSVGPLANASSWRSVYFLRFLRLVDWVTNTLLLWWVVGCKDAMPQCTKEYVTPKQTTNKSFLELSFSELVCVKALVFKSKAHCHEQPQYLSTATCETVQNILIII